MLIIAQVVLLLCAFCVRTQDFKNLEERLTTTEDIVQRQSNLVSELTSKLEELSNENRVLKTIVKTLLNESEARKVAFSASLLASGSGSDGPHYPVTASLIYKKVFTNVGNGYDSNTGIFTAPVTGVYYIRFYAHCQTGYRMAVSLYKNGNVQCSVFSDRPITNGNASNGIVLTLEKGDQLYEALG
ncbi:hypothetical protein AMELA_G00067370 [Ameiurus melas]|uniref:C1q domain-containing protein n=1 Tax=Ameiurus melas TaxID=219545 RepID=A0A7J6B377_AMEME|nr:hypothetical protein AMELA_G00067370 [Ameiurus melas]